jgi:very-short-patch-repair endonuclease
VSKPADTLAFQLRAAKLPAHEREFRFHPERRWRFDFAFPLQKVALEVEGGLYIRGRHNRGAGYEADLEKYAEALCLGWRVLRVSPKHVQSGAALSWAEKVIRCPA